MKTKMKKSSIEIRHERIEFLPAKLEEGVIYVSFPYSTAVHLCCCGCGNRVVTPLGSLGWEVTFRNEKISLSSSIGNWSFPCQSHYWVKNGKLIWAERWSKKEISSIPRRLKAKRNSIKPNQESYIVRFKKWFAKMSF